VISDIVWHHTRDVVAKRKITSSRPPTNAPFAARLLYNDQLLLPGSDVDDAQTSDETKE
jgi:hypothetical protein